jgi:hypothetical protein
MPACPLTTDLNPNACAFTFRDRRMLSNADEQIGALLLGALVEGVLRYVGR